MTEQLTKEQKRIKTALAHFIDLHHSVAMAVEPLREKAIERAEQEAEKKVTYVRKALKAAGNDLKIAAPRPKGNEGRSKYYAMMSEHLLFSSITKWRSSSIRPNEPNFVDIDKERVQKFINDVKRDAANDYDAFIVKLCEKIGDCRAAYIEGDHIWGQSYLTVNKGPFKEVWKTQQIVNVSKLGRLFNQWPSRKLKH